MTFYLSKGETVAFLTTRNLFAGHELLSDDPDAKLWCWLHRQALNSLLESEPRLTMPPLLNICGIVLQSDTDPGHGPTSETVCHSLYSRHACNERSWKFFPHTRCFSLEKGRLHSIQWPFNEIYVLSWEIGRLCLAVLRIFSFLLWVTPWFQVFNCQSPKIWCCLIVSRHQVREAVLHFDFSVKAESCWASVRK